MSTDTDPARAHLIRRLFRLGMSVEAATAAVDHDHVILSLVDHLVGGPRTFSQAEAAARAGLPVEVATAIDRILGVGDDARYAESGIHHLSLVAHLLQILPQEPLIEQFRADIPALRTLALRTLDTARALFESAAITADDNDPVDTGVALAEIARPLLDVSTELIGQSYRRAVLDLITTDLVVESLRTDDETVDLAVGFVDVVGYTSLSARIDPRGLDEVLRAFEDGCRDVAERHPGMTLVKFMGDAAMFVSLDPVLMASGLFDLVQHRDEQVGPNPPVSAGMAFGQTLVRAGDYFGNPVNEAARLTDLARRHSVLVSDQLQDELDEVFVLRRLLPVMLQGLGRRRPYALRGLRDPDPVSTVKD